MEDSVQFSSEVVDRTKRRFVITVDLDKLRNAGPELGDEELLQTVSWISEQMGVDLKAALQKELGLKVEDGSIIVSSPAEQIMSEDGMGRMEKLIFAIALAIDVIHKKPDAEEDEHIAKACEILRTSIFIERCSRLDPGQILVSTVAILADAARGKQEFFPETSRFRFQGEYNKSGYAKCTLEKLPKHDSEFRRNKPIPASLGTECWLRANQFMVEGEDEATD